MIQLEEKFQAIESRLKNLHSLIESNSKHVEEHVNKTLTLDEQSHRISMKRKKLLSDLEKHEEHETNKLAQHPQQLPHIDHQKSLVYLKHDRKEHFKSSMKMMLHKLCKLKHKKEFKLFRKLRYYHIYKAKQGGADSNSKRDRPSLEAKQNFFRLSKITHNSYVAVDKKLSQLVLYDLDFDTIKSVQIKGGYNCRQMKVIDPDRIVLDFTTKNCTKTFIYIFDFELNVVNRTIINLEFLFIHFTQNVFFYRHPTTSDLHVYDTNLQQIDVVGNELKLDKNYLLILMHLNRLVLYSFNVKKIGFIDKKLFKLVKAMPMIDKSKIVLFADMKSRVYLGVHDEATDSYSITCSDADGNVIFTQVMDSSKGDNFFFEDNYFYVFDNDYLLDSVY